MGNSDNFVGIATKKYGNNRHNLYGQNAVKLHKNNILDYVV